MNSRHFALLTFLLISSIGFSQTQESRVVLKSQRLEQARQWLLFAGVDPPSQFDIANIGYLRTALRGWADRTDADSRIAVPTASEAKVDASALIQIGDLYPGPGGRFSNLFQFKAEGQEQPQTVIVNNKPVQNPSHVLHKYSGTASLSQLVLSSSDLATVYSGFRTFTVYPGFTNFSGKNVFGKDGSSKEGPCKELEGLLLFQCLSRSRSRDIAARLVAGTTLNLADSENPQVVQGLIVPGTSPKWLISGGVDFDPK